MSCTLRADLSEETKRGVMSCAEQTYGIISEEMFRTNCFALQDRLGDKSGYGSLLLDTESISLANIACLWFAFPQVGSFTAFMRISHLNKLLRKQSKDILGLHLFTFFGTRN